jgi:hypothetical protein
VSRRQACPARRIPARFPKGTEWAFSIRGKTRLSQFRAPGWAPFPPNSEMSVFCNLGRTPWVYRAFSYQRLFADAEADHQQAIVGARRLGIHCQVSRIIPASCTMRACVTGRPVTDVSSQPTIPRRAPLATKNHHVAGGCRGGFQGRDHPTRGTASEETICTGRQRTGHFAHRSGCPRRSLGWRPKLIP